MFTLLMYLLERSVTLGIPNFNLKTSSVMCKITENISNVLFTVGHSFIAKEAAEKGITFEQSKVRHTKTLLQVQKQF